jgi:hypothetical protein
VRFRLLILIVLFGLWSGSALAQEKPTAFIGGEIIPIAGAPIPKGVLIVHKGKIVAVGAVGAVQIPKDAEKVDCTGKVLMPGLVDSHSHIGGPQGADGSAAMQADVRAYDAINPRDPGMVKALAGGITTVNIMPGSGHLLSGQTIYVKLRRRANIEELFIVNEDGSIAGGVKMANGTNSIRPNPPFPGTRAKSAITSSAPSPIATRSRPRRAIRRKCRRATSRWRRSSTSSTENGWSTTTRTATTTF